MARRSALSRSFRSDSQLSQFFLDGVTATGKVLGVGSYGSVVEVCEQRNLSRLKPSPFLAAYFELAKTAKLYY